MSLPALPEVRGNHGCGLVRQSGGNPVLLVFGGSKIRGTAAATFPVTSILFLDLSNVAKGWYANDQIWLGDQVSMSPNNLSFKSSKS